MLNKLSIRQKILIAPGLAVVGFCVVFVVTFYLGSLTARQLQRVQTGYYPSVELSQSLGITLSAIQRGLQDAASASNRDGLRDVDTLRDTFMQTLSNAQDNPVLDRSELGKLGSEMEDYYKTARATTEKMITNPSDESLSEALNSMREKYLSIRDKLEANNARDRAAIAKAFDDTRISQHYALVFMGLTTLTCLVPMIALSVRLTGAVSRSLLEVVRVADAMAQGDMTVSIDAASSDETGSMLRALREMIESLNELFGHVKHSGVQLDSVALRISSAARVQEAGVADVDSSTHNIASAVTQISLIGQDLERAMSHVSSAVANASASASVGQRNLEHMDESMTQLQQSQELISRRLAVMSEKAEAMNQVVLQITKVTDQTNLLSLNASIEAAKAGEAGKGFAVVAREIRRLADETAVGTLDIERIVQEMQLAMTESLAAISILGEQVTRGVKAADDTSEQLQLIIDHVHNLTPQVEAARKGTQSQLADARQISEAMQHLVTVSEHTSASIQEFMQSTDELHSVVSGLRHEMLRFKTVAVVATESEAMEMVWGCAS